MYWWEIEQYVDTPIYDGEPDSRRPSRAGPAIIELPHTTVPVRPEQTARLIAFGNLLINV